MKLKNTLMKCILLALFVICTFVITGCQTPTNNKNTYEVTFDSNGGSAVETQKVNEGDRAVKPKNPTQEGFLFIEWQLDGVKYDFAAEVKNDITLVAKWQVVAGPEQPTITITAPKNNIAKDETLTFTVTVENSEDKSYKWEVSDETLVAMNGDTLTVLKDVKIDTNVKVTAVLNADNKIKTSKTITVKAPVIDGQVGELTSEMLAEIANASITVNGVVTDRYVDFNMAANNVTNKYDFMVKMAEGSWYGEWNHQLAPDNKIKDQYQMSEKDGYKDDYGNVGHALERLYINKDNEVAAAVVKNYNSIPTVWEAQHLWNHLGNLQINKFTYDPENFVYSYNIDFNNADDLYLMTYLSISLTPMLSDTLNALYLTVEDGKITSIVAQTEILYTGDDPENPSAMSYTEVEITLSNIGTTVVENPKPFETPEHADLLKDALEKMQNATNYTFHAVDTQTSAPSGDGGDYEISSLAKAKTTHATRLAAFAVNEKVRDFVSAAGTVGTWGWVTEDAVLFAKTGKYSYTMDGNEYFTNYSGYKQNDNNTYDEFKYQSSQDALVGVRRHNGQLIDALPGFELSENIFAFESMSSKNGVTLYTFVLNESSIMRDVAMEVSAYDYADDALASSSHKFKITVDQNGNLVSTTYPYDLVSGTFLGYCTTTYTEIGTTSIGEKVFEDYVPRVVAEEWADYTTKYYSPTCSTLDTREENTAVVLQDAFGDKADSIPAPTVFLAAFGDAISGPFFDWKEKGVDADGNPVYAKYISITATSSKFDENAKITNYDEIIEILGDELVKAGFVLSPANTDTTGGESGKADRIVCYMNEDITIVIENNYTKYFWIYFYQTGDWSLKK